VDFNKLLMPVPRTAQFIDDDFFIWGASMYRDEGGTCHLFYSRWPRALGMNAWVTHSEIAYAVSQSPTGPYRFVNVALPKRDREYWDGLSTHNPTIHAFNGQLYLYYTGNTGDGQHIPHGLNWTHRNRQRIGVAVSRFPWGPWERNPSALIDTGVDPEAPDNLCTNNPSVTRMNDGKYLMVYKAVASKNPLPFGGPVTHMAAIASDPTGPFKKFNHPIFTIPGNQFPAEDPYIWNDGSTYYAIVKDMDGGFTKRGKSLCLFSSDNGIDWSVADHPLVAIPEITWDDGVVQKVHRIERPQLWLENGKPGVLFCAVSPNQSEEHSFNVHIPLAL